MTVAEGNRDLRQILLVVALGVAFSVFRKAESGPLFRLGPQTLAADIGSYTRENLRAQNSEIEHAHDDGDKHCNDGEQFSGNGKTTEYFSSIAHAGICRQANKT